MRNVCLVSPLKWADRDQDIKKRQRDATRQNPRLRPILRLRTPPPLLLCAIDGASHRPELQSRPRAFVRTILRTIYSFTGERFAVDAGTFSYDTNPERRRLAFDSGAQYSHDKRIGTIGSMGIVSRCPTFQPPTLAPSGPLRRAPCVPGKIRQSDGPAPGNHPRTNYCNKTFAMDACVGHHRSLWRESRRKATPISRPVGRWRKRRKNIAWHMPDTVLVTCYPIRVANVFCFEKPVRLPRIWKRA